MKKLTYLLVLMFSLVLFTSCEKDKTTDPVVEQTPGELYPEYVGNWEGTYVMEDKLHPCKFDIDSTHVIISKYEYGRWGVTSPILWRVDEINKNFEIEVHHNFKYDMKFHIESEPTLNNNGKMEMKLSRGVTYSLYKL